MKPAPIHLPQNAEEPLTAPPEDKADSASAPEQDIVFFYLGKSPTQGKLLIDTFHSGFFLQEPDGAMPLFLRTLESSTLPVIIIFNGSLGKVKLREVYHALPARIQRTAPIYIDATKLNRSDRQSFAKLDFINDIISLKDLGSEKLLASARFMCKIKAANGKIRLETRRLPTFLRSVESRQLAKRLIDIVLSSAAIVILSPVFIVIALAIVVESGGPVLYVSPRAGRGYRIFNFFKFRTMVPSTEGNLGKLSHLNQYTAEPSKKPSFFKATNDPRITGVGAILRSTSLDELPQFINVLKGDMSLVGNRPLPLYEAETLTSDECAVRFLAPAGITGLWQIKKRLDREMSAEERIDLDIAYAHRNNLIYDLWIMANTPSALIQKSNA